MNQIYLTRVRAYSHSRKIKSFLLMLLFASVAFLIPKDANASHYRYGNIRWTRVNSSTRTVTITVTTAWRTSFFSGITIGNPVSPSPINLDFGDGSGLTPVTLIVTSINGPDDWFECIGSINHTYAGTGTNFLVNYSSNARLSTLLNNANGTFSSQTEVVLVAGNTGSPVSTLPPIINLPINQAAASFNVPATDPDGSTLTFSLATASQTQGTNPSGLAINSSTGVATFNTIGKTVGQLWNGTFNISDASGSNTIVDFIMQMVPPNTPPIFDYSVTPANNTTFSINPGNNLTFSVKALDVDAGSTVTLTAVGQPTGVSFSPALPVTGNPVTDNFSFTPTTAQLGIYVITFIATRNGGVQTNTTVTINVNTNPQFIPPTKAQGVTYMIPTAVLNEDTIVAENPDSNVNTRIQSASIPSGATLSPTVPTALSQIVTTVMSWHPSPSDFGPHTVSFTAQDSNGRVATRSYILYPNTPPIFTSTPVTTGHENVVYTYNITLADSNLGFGDTLTISTMSIPSWLTLTDNGDGTATLTGTPGPGNAGSYNINLHGEDLWSHAEDPVEQTFTIVIDPCNVSLSLSMTNTSCPASNDGTATVSYSSNGSSFSVLWSTNATTNTVTGLSTGTYYVTVTDNFGCSASDSIMVGFYPDTIAPGITCPSNISVNNDANQCGAVVNFSTPSATDNCSVNISGTDTFNFTGSVETFIVPSGITSINIAAYGAAGGLATEQSSNGGGTGGKGGSVIGNISVIPLETLYIRVGGKGADANNTSAGAGGYNGGGNGASLYSYFTSAGGGGGGASDVRIGGNTLTDRVIVGAGGGAAGTNCAITYSGGNGGGLTGSNGTPDCTNGNTFGGGGTQTSGGSAGAYFSGSSDPGTLGGGGNANTSFGIGGGGGAGYYGGGGGDMGGGGGGSSFIIPSATSVNYTTGDQQGNGQIIISWNLVYPTVTQTAGPASGSLFPVGTTTVTFQAKDASNNSSACSFDVTVTDNENPTITCPSDVSVNNDAGNCSAVVTIGTPTTNDNCGVASVTNDHTSTTYPVGTTTVTWTVTDIHNNTATCMQSITVTDNENPTIACPSDVSVNNDAGNCSAVVNLGTPTTNDNCGVASVTNDHASTTYPVGTTTVTWTVTDLHNNTATCTQTVTVTDNENPTITCPSDVSVNNDAGNCSAVVTIGTPTTNDNCGVASVTNDHTSTTYPVGTTTVTWTVTDIHNNTATCTQTVTVTDNENPTITCPSDVSVNNDAGNCSAVVNLGTPTTNDNCGVASVTNDHTSTTYPVGTTTVTWTVTDIHNNTATCTQSITVTDNENPTITCPSDVSVNNDAGNCSAVVNLGTPTTNDNCGVASVTNDHASTTYPVGTTTVTWTVTDIHNNTATCTQTVTVTDNENPTITCPANKSVNNDAGVCSAVVNIGTPTTNDNCSVASVTNDHASTTYPVGTTTVTWTVTDIHNNTATCAQTVTVTDNENPTITCPSDISVNNDAGNCSAVVTIGTPTTNDNCGVASVTNDHASTTYPVGTTTVTWTVTDIHGNTATCNQTVVVTDNEAPVVHTQNITVTLSSGANSITASQVNNGSTDNCDIASYSVSPNTFNCSNIGANTVTLTVTDIHGHSSTGTAIVTVTGGIPTVSISQSMLPGFCQGGAVVLTANASAGVTYLWSTGATTKSINVYASGTYTVTVKNGYGCTASSSTSVSYNAPNMLSSYTVIATEQVEFESHSFVQTGGVGVTDTHGEIEAEDHSTITGTGTFARAHDIDVHSGSSITTQISTPAAITLPAFKNNPYNSSGSNVTVANNGTVTLSDSIYKNINIGTNATVTFTKPVVYIKSLSTNSGAKIKFSNCCILKIINAIEIGPYNQFNTDEKGVIVYAMDEVDIDKGSTINGSIYSLEKIEVEGTYNAQVSMKGLFIGEEIEAEYSTWNWNSVCTGCSLNKTESSAAENENIKSTLTDEIQFNVFPNPTTGKFNIEINSTLEGPLKITVYNYLGEEVQTFIKPNFTGTATVKVDLKDAASSYYLVKVEMAGRTLYKKVILTKL
jgi:hypothetical protein